MHTQTYKKIICNNCKIIRIVSSEKVALILNTNHQCPLKSAKAGSWEIKKESSFKYKNVKDLFINLFMSIYLMAELDALKLSEDEKHKELYKLKLNTLEGKENFSHILIELQTIRQLSSCKELNCLLDYMDIYGTITWYFCRHYNTCDPRSTKEDWTINDEKLKYLKSFIDVIKADTRYDFYIFFDLNF